MLTSTDTARIILNTILNSPKPGNYRLDEEEVGMQILPSKLRIKWPRTFDKDKCPLSEYNATTNVGTKCPPSADIPKEWGDHLPVIHCDFKMPSEHTLNGKRYAGEYQIWHWQPNGRHAPVVNVLVDVPDTPGMMEDEYHNDYFQVAIDEWKKVHVRSDQCLLEKYSKTWVESTHDQASVGGEEHKGTTHSMSKLYSLEPEESTTYFDPYHSSLVPSVWFYGYDKASLTEPPCTPLASYHIIDTPMRISTSQFHELQYLLFSHVDMDLTDDHCTPTGVHFEGSVARPIQPLGVGRHLHRCTCTDFFSDKFRYKTGLRDCGDSFER